MSLTQEQLDNLSAAAQAAVQSEAATGVPAELTVPQWIDESGWGRHQPGNNPFGIKAVGDEAYTRCATTEVVAGAQEIIDQNFEAFPTLADAFTRHANLITTGTFFRSSFEQYQQDRDFPAYVRALSAHYATDPDYADKILTLSRGPHVTAAIQSARGNINSQAGESNT